MNKLRIGVIGVGHLGAHHVKLLSELPSVELTGIYDPDKDRSSFIAGEVKTREYASVDELLRDVQCVSIVAPTSKHFDIAWEAIKREVHVFIEKPITSTTDEAQSL